MLVETRQMYQDNADFLPGWKKMTKSQLCNMYLELKEKNDSLADSCLSAIICKCWNIASHNYYSQVWKNATEGDCYDWLIQGILYTLDKHVWTDPNNALYGDECGPEKALNVVIYSLKTNFYQAIKRANRQINYESYSLEGLMEDSSEGYYTPYKDKYEVEHNYIDKKIKTSFDEKDYFTSFILDAIVNFDLSKIEEEDNSKVSVFSLRELKRHLRSIDKGYCKIFADNYNLDCDKVQKALPYIQKSDFTVMDRKVKSALNRLRKDKEFIGCLKA